MRPALNEDEQRLLGTSSSDLGLSYLPTTLALPLFRKAYDLCDFHRYI